MTKTPEQIAREIVEYCESSLNAPIFNLNLSSIKNLVLDEITKSIQAEREAMNAKMPEFPSEKELNEERKRFYREMGKFSGMSDTEIERQIDFIGWHVWIACYQWLKERLCVE
jgi:hypothetical protein